MSSARFLALGDSYTIGEQVDAGARWPVQLAAMLRAGGTRVDDPEIIATTGWTTDELAAGIARASPIRLPMINAASVRAAQSRNAPMFAGECCPSPSIVSAWVKPSSRASFKPAMSAAPLP